MPGDRGCRRHAFAFRALASIARSRASAAEPAYRFAIGKLPAPAAYFDHGLSMSGIAPFASSPEKNCLATANRSRIDSPESETQGFAKRIAMASQYRSDRSHLRFPAHRNIVVALLLIPHFIATKESVREYASESKRQCP
jgi:hypothetical protein